MKIVKVIKGDEKKFEKILEEYLNETEFDYYSIIPVQSNVIGEISVIVITETEKDLENELTNVEETKTEPEKEENSEEETEDESEQETE